MTGPTLFLFAAPRAGSTQLAHWLDSHPEIQLCPVKEPNHFTAATFDPAEVARSHLNDVQPGRLPRRRAQFAVISERSDYLALFEHMTAPWRLDASTTYLGSEDAAFTIARLFPEARAIVLTRDPVLRALSHYGLALRTGRSRRSLRAELQDELCGKTPPWARFLIGPSASQKMGKERVLESFGNERVLVTAFEQLIAFPQDTLEAIAGFLDIDPSGFDLGKSARNQTALPRFPGLNEWALKSGIKTRLRRLIPPLLKPVLRDLWFTESRALPVTAEERAALAAAIQAATE